MSAHSKRSPSKAKRTIHCSGNLALVGTLPDHQVNVSGEAARIGTCVHGLIEKCLKEGKEPSDFLDRIVELVGEEEGFTMLKPNAKTPGPGRLFYIVNAEMIEGATVCTDYVRGRCKELGVDESALQLETRTNPLPDRDDTSGTADVTIDAWPTVLEVLDFKNGWIVVETKTDQGIAYLLGKAIEDDFAHESYMVTIVQPNASDPELRAPRSVEYTREELLEWQAMYRAAVERCDEADAAFAEVNDPESPAFRDWSAKYLKAGEHCTFCEAAAICPAKTMLHQAQAKIDFADEPHQIDFDSRRRREISHIMKWAPHFAAFFKAVAAYAQREMEAGFDVDGQKLVRGKTNRVLKPGMTEAEIVSAILKGKFVTDKGKLYDAPALKTGPQIEKLVPAKRRKEFAAAFLHKPEGALTIAPADDPRPAVSRSAADDFDDFEDEDEIDFG
ncbi:DUF2800 domain-containing protein [Bradyrhizobium liaoningense]|uniref:DUF2800 domain-containing protein n=1 Tax=Bradyrhizobium liaoningense TaxID=43992 RepID=UPI001BA55478|nr:DUF2800 domain-containing protein [Bradyrhizobium liaoningense]MBR0876910.1 DUF2800 domain-containing protein [Bradyrhizobium liaoningense]